MDLLPRIRWGLFRFETRYTISTFILHVFGQCRLDFWNGQLVSARFPTGASSFSSFGAVLKTVGRHFYANRGQWNSKTWRADCDDGDLFLFFSTLVGTGNETRIEAKKRCRWFVDVSPSIGLANAVPRGSQRFAHPVGEWAPAETAKMADAGAGPDPRPTNHSRGGLVSSPVSFLFFPLFRSFADVRLWVFDWHSEIFLIDCKRSKFPQKQKPNWSVFFCRRFRLPWKRVDGWLHLVLRVALRSRQSNRRLNNYASTVEFELDGDAGSSPIPTDD